MEVDADLFAECDVKAGESAGQMAVVGNAKGVVRRRHQRADKGVLAKRQRRATGAVIAGDNNRKLRGGPMERRIKPHMAAGGQMVGNLCLSEPAIAASRRSRSRSKRRNRRD